jgi:tetratricopeptide (TPR) repeat protein
MSVERSEPGAVSPSNRLNVERSAPRGAVFLSYASQDSESAKRICEALRAAGVEVWFDQSELRGGDAWDQSIRRQIKECALFIPVVSANTQARREGYFRLEWKLADDRTHLMAKGTRFILPVCVDDTRDWDAIVPDSFTTVQWTRLSGGEGAGAFAERVKKLLGGEVEAGRPLGAVGLAKEARPVQRDGDVASPTGRSRPPRSWLVPAILGAAGVVALAVWQPWRQSEKPSATAPSASPAPGESNGLSPAAQLAAKARQLYDKIGFTRDDLLVAEDLSRRATELEPDSAAAWGVRAGVHASYIFRNWDLSEKRRQDAQSFANRALALNPDEAEALLALGRVLSHQGADDQAETILRRALKLLPDDNRVRRALGVAIIDLGPGRLAEGRAELQEAVRRHPRDVLAHYDLAQSYNPNSNRIDAPPAALAAMIEQLDAALAVQPFGGALVLKAQCIMAEKGDLAAMRAALDQLAPEDRTEDRAVFTAMWCGLLERKPERVIGASALTARDYFEDAIIASPKAWYVALAHRMAGQENQARLDWQAAEGVMRHRLQEQPDDSLEKVRLAVSLAWLGRDDEAARLVAPVESAWREQSDPSPRTGRLLADYYAGLGDAVGAVRCLRVAFYRSALITPATLPLDPWWDKLRGQPEFEAFMAGLKPQPGPSLRQPGSAPGPSPSAAKAAMESQGTGGGGRAAELKEGVKR